MPTCPEFLGTLFNRRCFEEFLKTLPEPIRNQLANAIDILNTALNLEGFLTGIFDSYYQQLLAQLANEIGALQAELAPLLEALDAIQEFYRRFQDCPGVNTMVALITEDISRLTDGIEDAIFRQNKALQFIQFAGVQNADLLVKRYLIGANPVIQDAQDFLDGVGDCLRGGTDGINPAFR